MASKNVHFEGLNEIQEELKAIFEATPSPLVITSKSDGHILYANHHFGTAFGVTTEKLLGRKAPDLYYNKEDRKKLLDTLTKSGGVENYEVRVKKLDGKPFWVNASVQPLVFKNEQALIAIFTDITKRKQAENVAEQLRRRNELILKSAGQGIYGLDQNGNTTFVNPAAAKMLGWEANDLMGKPQHTVIHHTKPDGTPYPREECPIYAAFNDGLVHTIDSELFWRKDGSSFPVEYISTPIRNENGQLAGAVVAFRDITHRKQAEEELEQLRQKNELILDSAGEGIYGLDKNGNTTFVNPAAAKMLGWESDELLGQPQHAVIHHTKPDGTPYPREECPIYAAFTDGLVHSINNEVFWRKDGTSFPVEYTSTPIRANDNDVVGAVVIFRDIAERKKAERELQESEARFSGILDIAMDAIISTDESQHIIMFNEGAEEVFNYSPNEVLGKPIEVLIPEKFHEVHDSHIAKFVSSNMTARLIGQRKEIFGRRKDGEIFPAEASISKLQLDGKLILTVILRDITKRKQADNALQDALAEVEKLKDRLQAENIYLQEEIKLQHNFDQIISASESFKKVLRNVEQVAVTDATVLILGETGTGKELIARAVHTTSSRSERPLVKVNCAALPPTLIESELLGHEKGAFTGAVSRRQGRFELADQGTIFLDEIGDLPLDLQAKMLRVLQEGEFERVGGTQTLNVDVRVIAATNRDLEQAIQAGEFREDLFYRLNVFPITLPPLRKHREDIPLLANHFIKKYAAKLGKKISQVPQKVTETLQAYHFPGNVRELENIIERAIILAEGETLRLDESLDLLKRQSTSAEDAPTLEEVERNHIISVLQETNWRIEGPKGAALRLGINSNTLRSRMQKLGIRKST